MVLVVVDLACEASKNNVHTHKPANSRLCTNYTYMCQVRGHQPQERIINTHACCGMIPGMPTTCARGQFVVIIRTKSYLVPAWYYMDMLGIALAGNIIII